MPSINLRLTENEHEELARWARDGHRSLQKEIIFRLFSDRLSGAHQEAVPTRVEELRSVRASDLSAVLERGADQHFKPDPK